MPTIMFRASTGTWLTASLLLLGLSRASDATTTSFQTPTRHVSSYIYELDVFSELAPCARDALRSEVQKLTFRDCPSNRNGLAHCACEEDDHSKTIDRDLKRYVTFSCSYISADVKSAWDVFAAYCLLNSGITSMPSQTNLQSDMTYYITEMPEFSSLKACAQGQIREIMSMSSSLCPDNGPEALASCLCFKEMISRDITRVLSSDFYRICTTSASERLSSAFDLLHLYCSAAKGQTKLSVGVVTSARETGGTIMWNDVDHEHQRPSNGTIAATVVVSVLGGLALGIAIWCLVKRRAKIRTMDQNIPLTSTRVVNSLPAPTSQTPADADRILPAEGDEEVVPLPYEAGAFGEMYAKTEEERRRGL